MVSTKGHAPGSATQQSRHTNNLSMSGHTDIKLRRGYDHSAGNGSGQSQFWSKDFTCIYWISTVPWLSDPRSHWEPWIYDPRVFHISGPSHTNNYEGPLASGRTSGRRMKPALQTLKISCFAGKPSWPAVQRSLAGSWHCQRRQDKVSS